MNLLSPEFFSVLGAPRCGTTRLFSLLGQHPDIQLSSPKEPHFFDVRYDGDFDAYLQDHFSPSSTASWWGEATPTYLVAGHAARRISHHVPDARLIVSLRDPVERAFSSWWLLYSRGIEPHDFEEALELNREQIEENGTFHPENGGIDTDGDRGTDENQEEERWIQHMEEIWAGGPIRVRSYLEEGFYTEQLGHYLELFPRDQLMVIQAEVLFADEEKTVRSVWDFLDLPTAPPLDLSGPRNRPPSGWARSLLSLAHGSGLVRWFRRLPDCYRSRAKQLLSLGGGRPELEDVAPDWIHDYYSDRLRKLDGLVEIDLDRWSTSRTKDPDA